VVVDLSDEHSVR